MPGRNVTLDPEIAASLYVPTTCQPSCAACSRHIRIWSSIDDALCWSEE